MVISHVCKHCRSENIIHAEEIKKVPDGKINFLVTYTCPECAGKNILIRTSLLLENKFSKLSNMKPEKESYRYYFRKVLLRTKRMQVKE